MENKKSITLIPIAMLFLIIGLLFGLNTWLKYAFMGLALVLSIVSLVLSLKKK